jgi:hypothetical protein
MKNTLNSTDEQTQSPLIQIWCEKLIAVTTRSVSEKVKQTSNDFYLLNPPLKPKSEIADYIDTCGISTPKRYKSISEALNSWDDFIIRSEHPYEYAWIWGLLNSFRYDDEARGRAVPFVARHWMLLSQDDYDNFSWQDRDTWIFYKLIMLMKNWFISEEDFEEYMKLTSKKAVRQFARISRTDESDFLNQIWFSYWKYIPGYNRSIIADDSVKWRYHIITNWWTNRYYRNYAIYDNWSLLPNEVSEFDPVLRDRLDTDLLFYESVRNLPRFDWNNCPIIEFQTWFDWTNHFLQTHYWRTKNEANFVLDRSLGNWESEVEFVRWSTTQDWYSWILSLSYHYAWPNDKDIELWSNDPNYDMIFSWFMDIKKKVWLVQWSFDRIKVWITCHTKINRLFWAELSVVLDIEKVIDEVRRKRLHRISRYLSLKGQSSEFAWLNFRVISDWKKCYFKILDDIDAIIEKYSYVS